MRRTLVVLTTANQVAFTEKAVESFRICDLKDADLLVVDDASKDGTVDYWAVRDAPGTFAIGRPAEQPSGDADDPDMGPPPRMCGIGMIPPLILLTTSLFIARMTRGREKKVSG